MAEELAGGKLLLDEPAEAVARLRINNPAKRNALDHDILDALAEVLPRLDHGIDVRCVVITGAQGHFSAGYDIGSISEESLERDARSLVAHPFNVAIEALADHPWPTVAAISGDCLGGGLEMAITCDLRICAGEARLGMPPVKLGLIYGHTTSPPGGPARSGWSKTSSARTTSSALRSSLPRGSRRMRRSP
jgi:enoyl-CoA hydratase/carnithine racemase